MVRVVVRVVKVDLSLFLTMSSHRSQLQGTFGTRTSRVRLIRRGEGLRLLLLLPEVWSARTKTKMKMKV